MFKIPKYRDRVVTAENWYRSKCPHLDVRQPWDVATVTHCTHCPTAHQELPLEKYTKIQTTHYLAGVSNDNVDIQYWSSAPHRTKKAAMKEAEAWVRVEFFEYRPVVKKVVRTRFVKGWRR